MPMIGDLAVSITIQTGQLRRELNREKADVSSFGSWLGPMVNIGIVGAMAALGAAAIELAVDISICRFWQ